MPSWRVDNSPNLSILIREGKENNNDAPSNGERSGQSPNLKSVWRESNRIVVLRCVLGRDGGVVSPLEDGTEEGDSPVRTSADAVIVRDDE